VSAIVDVRAFPLQYPEPNDRDRLRCVTLARVQTDDGAVGWGECISQWPDSAVAVRTVVEEGLAPLLVGEDPRDPRRLWERMRDQTFWYGRGGIASFAISALDSAIWDLAGKLAGLPVHRLLGGAVHDRFRAAASIIWDPGDLDWTTREFAGYAERGFTAAKGGWGRDPATAFGTDGRRDVACVKAVREAVGPDFGLACDVSGKVRWTARHAVAMARAFEPYDLMWLEDALPPEDYEGWRRLSAAAPMPIATAERDWTVEDYRHRMDYAPVDILLVDPGRVEGVTGMWLIAQDAASRGVGVVPHSWSSALNTAAALHVLATCPTTPVFELKPHRSPLQHELVAEPFDMVDGHVQVPDRPGLSCDVDEAVVRKYLIGGRP
jgi:L-alanine-DL-glutamate epimerase-like enolase superfamily enzyme